MGARSLQARLTIRIFVWAGIVLTVVAVAAVVVTDRLLADGDTQAAMTGAKASLDAVTRELAEGDPIATAESEVAAEARASGLHLEFTPRGDSAAKTSVAPGTCIDVADDGGHAWRACAAADADRIATAEVAVGAHRDAVRSLARGMALVLVAAFAFLFLALRRSIRAPIDELGALVKWSEAVVEEEAPRALPEAHTDEIEKLERSFDALVKRLFRALERERASSAHIAHELRTPLTSIVADLDQLQTTAPDARAIVDRVRADVLRLAEVIDAVLHLSSTEQRIEGALVNVADVVREVAPTGSELTAPDEALVRGDERLLTLALKNILRNADAYGSGADKLAVSRHGDLVEISVSDRGRGVPDAVREKMFERYWRGEADGSGSGLGLALVRAVAERHGGFASAKPAPNGGLAVAISVPLVTWSDH